MAEVVRIEGTNQTAIFLEDEEARALTALLGHVGGRSEMRLILTEQNENLLGALYNAGHRGKLVESDTGNLVHGYFPTAYSRIED